MAVRSWSGVTGNWSDSTQWGGTLPGPADVASVNATGPYTITMDVAAAIAALVGGPSGTTLDITSGTLTLLDTAASSAWAGLLEQQGGLLHVANGTLAVTGTLAQTAGAISLDLATRLDLPNLATLGGAVSGLGTIGVGGAITLDGAMLSPGALTMGSTGTLVLAADQTLDGALQTTGGSIALAGHTLTLARSSNVGGVQVLGPGTLAVTGLAMGSLNLHGTLALRDGGVIVGDGLNVGNGVSDDVTATIAAGATLDLRADGVVSGNNAGVIANQGLFEKSEGGYGGRSNVQAAVNNTGTLRAQIGTLLLTNSGTNTLLGGTLDGAGTLDIGGNATLAAGAAVSVATLAVTFGGTLTLAGNAAPSGALLLTSNGTLALAGNTLSIAGQGGLGGVVSAQGGAASPGSLIVDGTYGLTNVAFTGGTLWLEDAGTMLQAGYVTLGAYATDHVAFQIDASAVYHIVSDTNIYTYSGGGTLDAGILNNGLFWYDAGGATAATVNSAFANNIGGTVLVSKGDLAFGQSFINDGTMLVDGIASFAGGAQASTGHAGTISIAPAGTVAVSGGANAGESFNFDGTGGNLVINTPGAFNGQIVHFGAGDTIDVKAHANSWVESAGTVTLLFIMNGTTTAVGTLNGAFVPGFGLTEDGSGGTYIYGTSPSNTFGGLTFSPVPYDTALPGAGTLAWNNPLDWSLGATPTNQTIANIDSSTTTVVYGQDPLGQSTGTVEALFTPSSPVTLDMAGGNLTVLDYASGWGGPVFQTGGLIESVTGLAIGGSTYELAAAAMLRSDSGRLSVGSTGFDVAGALQGAGTIEATGTMIIEPAAVISVATLVAGPSGEAIFAGGTTLTSAFEFDGALSLAGTMLTLNDHARLNGAMIDPGTIALAGTGDVSNFAMQATAELLAVSGLAIETSGDVGATQNGAIAIAAGGTWDLQSDSGIYLHGGTGELVNSGLFEKSAGSGVGNIEAQVTSTGTLVVASGSLNLQYGALDLAGTVEGAGALLAGTYNSNITTTLEPGLILAVATLAVDHLLLKADQTYAGNFTTAGNLTLGGHALTLSGTSELAGTVLDAGTIAVSGTADINNLFVGGLGTRLRLDGVATQSGQLALGQSGTDSATLDIAAGATLDEVADNNIGGLFGSIVAGTIDNAGLFEKTGGSQGGGGSSILYAGLVNTGSVLVNQGTLTLHGAAVNDGTVSVNAMLVAQGSLGAGSGQSGRIVIGPYGTLVVQGAIAADQTITYDPGGLIQIGQPGSFAAAIAGFAPGDRIEFTSTTAIATVGYAAGTITLAAGNGATLAAIAAPGLTNPAGLTLSSDGANTFLNEAPCFAAGTRLLGARGEVAVEDLRPGDLVATWLGCRLRPVRWVGATAVDLGRHPCAAAVAPVRVTAGAFGRGLPHRDLLLSPDHALLLDGALVPVHLLVNGATLRREPAQGVVRYYHVELDQHDAVLAEGLPAESYLDTGNRAQFRNAGAVAALHPEIGHGAWSARGCAVLLQGGARVAALHAGLLRHAAALGFRLTTDPGLHLFGAGGEILLAEVAPGTWRARLPAETAALRLLSRRSAPRDLRPGDADARPLGVALAALRIDGRDVALDDTICAAGFHRPEGSAATPWRWTDGAATLRLPPSPGAALLEFDIRGDWLRYWEPDARGRRAASRAGATAGGLLDPRADQSTG